MRTLFVQKILISITWINTVEAVRYNEIFSRLTLRSVDDFTPTSTVFVHPDSETSNYTRSNQLSVLELPNYATT